MANQKKSILGPVPPSVARSRKLHPIGSLRRRKRSILRQRRKLGLSELSGGKIGLELKRRKSLPETKLKIRKGKLKHRPIKKI